MKFPNVQRTDLVRVLPWVSEAKMFRFVRDWFMAWESVREERESCTTARACQPAQGEQYYLDLL